MAWRDRLRRRAAVPDGPGGAAQPAASGADAPDVPRGSGGPGVPAGWDGGWRRTSAPPLTVSRAPLGVSDGLAFRSTLASWRNPTFDQGLGHALLPSAPAGLVGGVTRPATTAPTHSGGGPLLLRAVRAGGEEGPEPAPGSSETVQRVVRPGPRKPSAAGGAAAKTGPNSRPSVTASDASGTDREDAAGTSAPSRQSPGPSRRTPAPAVSPDAPRTSQGTPGTDDGAPAAPGASTPVVVSRSAEDPARGGDAPRTRGLSGAHTAAVLDTSPAAVQRAATPGAGSAVSPDAPRPRTSAPLTPVVRRVAVVPGTGTPPVQRAAGAPAAGGSGGGTSAGERGSGSGRSRGGNSSPASGSSGADTSRGTRTSTGTGTRTGTGTGTGSTGSGAANDLRPAVRARTVGRPLTVARVAAQPPRRQVTVLKPAQAPAPVRQGTPDAPAAPVTRAPASAPSASPSAPASGNASVQRAPGRAALGAPLSGLPSTATPLGTEPTSPTTAPASSPNPSLPVVQRQSETDTDASPRSSRTPAANDQAGSRRSEPRRSEPRPETPGRSAPQQAAPRPRTGLGAPMSALPSSAQVPGSRASRAVPPLSPADIQRALSEAQAAPRPAPGSPAGPTPTPPTPASSPTPQAPLLGGAPVPVPPPAAEASGPSGGGQAAPEPAPPVVQRAAAPGTGSAASPAPRGAGSATSPAPRGGDAPRAGEG
ncbi:hypothetical protein ABT160_45215, partial [Streptomyces sp. NPDC001941]